MMAVFAGLAALVWQAGTGTDSTGRANDVPQPAFSLFIIAAVISFYFMLAPLLHWPPYRRAKYVGDTSARRSLIDIEGSVDNVSARRNIVDSGYRGPSLFRSAGDVKNSAFDDNVFRHFDLSLDQPPKSHEIIRVDSPDALRSELEELWHELNDTIVTLRSTAYPQYMRYQRDSVEDFCQRAWENGYWVPILRSLAHDPDNEGGLVGLRRKLSILHDKLSGSGTTPHALTP